MNTSNTKLVALVADAIRTVPLSISSTRRGGNGLRNAEEVARVAIEACRVEELRDALALIAAPLAPSPDDEDAVPAYTKVIADYTRRVAVARAAIAKLDGRS